MECPCKGDPLNHTIYHDLGKDQGKWVNICIIRKSTQHGWPVQDVSCFIWEFLLGFQRRERLISPLRVENVIQAFIQSTRPLSHGEQPVACLDPI